MRLTSRVLVRNRRGQVLAILEGGRSSSVALPGGAVERGESAKQAAARELFEETGLRATALAPICIVRERGRESIIWSASTKGRLRGSDEGPVRWAWPAEFLAGDYADFSAVVFDVAGV